MFASTRPGSRRATPLATAAVRAAIPPGQREWQPLGNGVALGYRRSASASKPGVWLLRWATPSGPARYAWATLGIADDLLPADGRTVLSYAQAVARAAEEAASRQQTAAAAERIGTAGLSGGTTVAAACQRYCVGLEERGGRVAREARSSFRKWLGDLGGVQLTALTPTDTHVFAERAPARVVSSVKAALNALPETVRPALAVLRAMNIKKRNGRRRAADGEDAVGDVPDDWEVARRVAAARAVDPVFGLFAATAAGTGVRPSQLAALRVRDLHQTGKGWHLSVAPSEKGRGSHGKRVASLPLTEALGVQLKALTARRPRDAFLFVQPLRERVSEAGSIGWRVVGERPFAVHDWTRAAGAAGFAGQFYHFRHARICKLILAGVPLRLVAEHLDTSTAMIERSYSRWIASLGNDMLRLD